MPETEDEILSFVPPLNHAAVVYVFNLEGNSQQTEKNKNQGGQNLNHEESFNSLIHSWLVFQV